MNYIYNTTPKDDPPEIPRNCLYVVNTQFYPAGTTIPKKYHVSLQMSFPSGEDPTDWMCAAYWGVGEKVPGSDAYFDASGIATMVFAHYPSASVDDSKLYQVMVGKDANSNSLLDPGEASYVKIPADGNKTAEIEVHNYLDWARAWSVIILGADIGGWWGGKQHAANLLRIFRDGNTDSMGGTFKPSSSANVPFNCFSGEFSDWLTHNAGAQFDSGGSVNLKEYIWEPNTTYAALASNAPQFRQVEQSYWDNVKLPSLVAAWANKPIGHSEWVPSSTTWDNLPVPWVSNLEDPNVPDLFPTFGRVKVIDHKIRFFAKKTGANTIVKDGFNSKAEFIDLYDFNITTAFPGSDAAIVQLGYGNGNKNAPGGIIFRVRVRFEKSVSPS